VHRLKLYINNNEDKDQEEKMMKLYKELEFQRKYKFVIWLVSYNYYFKILAIIFFLLFSKA